MEKGKSIKEKVKSREKRVRRKEKVRSRENGVFGND
jgi:hypothetical protein